MDNQSLWKIINSFMNHSGKQLIRHHIDSFNDFIDNKIPCIIKQSNPISIFHQYDPAENNYNYEIVINFINSYNTVPMIHENDGAQNRCILRKPGCVI